MMNILMLMMGGSGTRFNSNIPKQYVLINDVPIFYYILETYNKLDCIDKIIIVSNPAWRDYAEEWALKLPDSKVATIVNGGDSRSGSVLNALNEAQSFAAFSDVVLIHDATHPYVDHDGVVQVIEAVEKYGGATLGQFQYDTCYRMNEGDHFITEVVPRRELVAGASPEAFKFGEIFKIYEQATQDELEEMTCAGAIALKHGINMKVIESQKLNLKITFPGDMEVFKYLIRGYYFNIEKRL